MLSPEKHLLIGGGAQCLAHSCDPNTRLILDPDSNCVECVALRDIAVDEVVSFNYLTTEWDMSCPFTCTCGSPQCFKFIAGYKHLSPSERKTIGAYASTAVKELAGLLKLKIPSSVTLRNGVLISVEDIPRATELLELVDVELFPTHIVVGTVTIKHSLQSNCVNVEGRLITVRDVQKGSALTINMCFFVYDMTAKFPTSFHAENKGFKYLEESIKQQYLYLCEPIVRAEAMRDGWIVVSTNPSLIVRPNGEMGQTAYAAVDIAPETTLFRCGGLVVSFPTMYTICVARNAHLLFGGAAECIAHHCDPNCVVVAHDHEIEFRTLKPICAGDMLSFNYNTTEWAMHGTFACLCGSPKCAKYIRGFKYLSDEDRQRLWSITSDFVKSLAAQ
jgi:hypothetical protein